MPMLEALEGLASGTRLMAALFDGMAEAMLLCDPTLTILAANRVAAELLETPSGRLVGRRASEVLPGCPPAGVDLAEPAAVRAEWHCQACARAGGGRQLEVAAVGLSDERNGVRGRALTLKEAGHAAAPPDFIGQSAVAQELLEFVSRIAASRAQSILLVGESGTGKDLIARRLHALSRRASSPFLPINCASLPEYLLESELFGYERGAFTGADQAKEGLLETADGGTVFLDEIGEMPLPLQAKLQRVLEDHTFRRVGGGRNISVDLRVICATNRDLEKAIEERRFRSDLYYRPNVVQIRLPAVRERPEDIPLLVEHFLEHFRRVHRRQIEGIDPTALRNLELYAWPGNVRELRNVIERAVLVESTATIAEGSLGISGPGMGAEPEPAPSPHKHQHSRFSLRKSERDLITAALGQAEGNQTRAAGLLGIGRFSLRYKMKKLGML